MKNEEYCLKKLTFQLLQLLYYIIKFFYVALNILPRDEFIKDKHHKKYFVPGSPIFIF